MGLRGRAGGAGLPGGPWRRGRQRRVQVVRVGGVRPRGGGGGGPGAGQAGQVAAIQGAWGTAGTAKGVWEELTACFLANRIRTSMPFRCACALWLSAHSACRRHENIGWAYCGLPARSGRDSRKSAAEDDVAAAAVLRPAAGALPGLGTANRSLRAGGG